MQIHVGCSGWFYWHWKKIFYPENLPTHRWFEHYTKHFNTVELNAPFYRWPKPATVKGWRRNAPENFRYSIKVNRLITHEKQMAGTKKLVREFCSFAEVLGPHMGCFLFQFPSSYKYTPARLKSIVEQVGSPHIAAPCPYHNVIESRHESWWRKSVYRAFKNAGIIFCSVSAPRLPHDLIKTSDVLYVRLHGRARWHRYDYSREELSEWAKKIADSGAKEVWAYFNNDANAFAIKNAKELRRRLKKTFLESRQAIVAGERA